MTKHVVTCSACIWPMSLKVSPVWLIASVNPLESERKDGQKRNTHVRRVRETKQKDIMKVQMQHEHVFTCIYITVILCLLNKLWSFKMVVDENLTQQKYIHVHVHVHEQSCA